MRSLRTGIPFVLAALGTASLAAAHDFWLVSVGDAVHGVSGSTFPRSENAVAPERLAEAVAVHAGGRTPLTVVGTGTGPAGDPVLVLRADLALRGTLWAAVAIKPRRIDLSAEEFNAYVRHDGLPQIAAEREAAGELGRPTVERYQKYAKALLVRPGGRSAALVPVGHRLELVPLSDPTTTARGDTLTFVVRYDGRPRAGLTVNAGWAGQPGKEHAQTHVSDAAGRVRIPLTTGGTWYARTIHMQRLAEAPYDWESFWASVTFLVR